MQWDRCHYTRRTRPHHCHNIRWSMAIIIQIQTVRYLFFTNWRSDETPHRTHRLYIIYIFLYFCSHVPYFVLSFSCLSADSMYFQNTAQLQYVEDSEPVTRSMWSLVNSAKTELQVQEELDKKRFLTSAPHGRGATSYTETVEYQDMIYWDSIESLKVSEVAVRIASGRIIQTCTVRG